VVVRATIGSGRPFTAALTVWRAPKPADSPRVSAAMSWIVEMAVMLSGWTAHRWAVWSEMIQTAHRAVVRSLGGQPQGRPYLSAQMGP
jgi:hypothetical protein